MLGVYVSKILMQVVFDFKKMSPRNRIEKKIRNIFFEKIFLYFIYLNAIRNIHIMN